jgi:hypothetical protein
MTTTLRQAVRWHPPLMYFAGAMSVLALVALGGLVLDDRVLVGAPIWLKPFKFAVSLGIYAVTVAWLLSLVTGRRAHRIGAIAATTIAVVGTIEISIIVGQVIRGRRSHFNVATTLDATLWSIMGSTIMLLWIATFVIGVLLVRQPMLDRATAWAIRLGIAVSLAGMAVAYPMTLPTADQAGSATPTVAGSHSVGVPEGGPGMPLTGWSTTGGDLRVPHFIGLHALQALPLLALALTVLARRYPLLAAESVRLRLVLVGAGLYAGVLVLLTWQALRAQPLIHPDALTLSAAGVLVVLAGIGAATAFQRPRVPVPA